MIHLPTQDAIVPQVEAALPVVIATGLDTGESPDLIQEPSGNATAATVGDNEPATEIDGVKAGMSPVDDAAVTTMATVVDANPANLVEEPSMDAAFSVDTVTQSSATKVDGSATTDVVAELSNADANLAEEPRAEATSNVDAVAQESSAVAVAELSNVDANLVEEPTADATSNVDAVAQEPSAVAVAELSNADADTIAIVGPAKGDVPSKEDEAVTETVPADNQDSAKTGEIPVDDQELSIAEAKEQHPTDKVESTVSKVRKLTLFKFLSTTKNVSQFRVISSSYNTR